MGLVDYSQATKWELKKLRVEKSLKFENVNAQL